MSTKKDPLPLNIVFQNLHYKHDWDIGITASLWGMFIYYNIIETLIRLEKNSESVPALASGQALSADKKTLKLSISDQYIFHDGTPITPEDVLSSLKRTLSSSKTTHSKIIDFLMSDDLDKSILLKGDTIEIKLKSHLNSLVYKLSIPDMGITPPNYLGGEKGKESLKNLSGPYKVIKFTPKKMELAKHVGHPLIDERSPDRVDIVEISDLEESIRYYQNNENVTLVCSGYGKTLRYIDLPGGEKYTSDFVCTEFFLPNVESPHLDTEEKRRAIFSTMKKAFKKINLDSRISEITHQIFTNNNLARLESKSLEKLYDGEITSDNKKLKKLSVIVLEYVKHNPIPHLINEQLSKFGIELEIVTGSNMELSDRFKRKEYDLIFLYSGVSAPDPLIELIYMFDTTFSRPAFNAKHLKELLKRAETEPDREKYISLLKEVHEGLLREYRILPLIHTKMIYAAKGDYKPKESGDFDGGFRLWDWRKK